MDLTEQQITLREDVFINFLETIAEELYDFSEDYEMTEEDAYVASIMMEHFIQNYKQPTLNDAVMESVTGYDINEDLFMEIIEAMMDETIGGFVAGAAHGIRNIVSKFRAKSQQNTAAKALKTRAATNQKYQGAVKAMKTSATNSSGISGAIKAGFHKAKVTGLQQRHRDDSITASKTAANRNLAKNIHRSNVRGTKNLANKIDTGITNIKNRVTGAIKTGASRFGSAVGKVAGALA
jgi:hypothetical protein